MKINIEDAKRIVNKVTNGRGWKAAITRLLKSSSQSSSQED